MSKDINCLFEMVDTNHKGYLTVEEVQRAYESVQMQWVEEPYVHQAMLSQGLSGHNRIPPDRFGDILKEMYHLKGFEEEARWTFFGIANSDRCISVEEALFLFQACHEDNFSLEHWASFLASREEASAPVTFDEIKFWLTLRPAGRPCSAAEVMEERKEIRARKADADVLSMRHFLKIENGKAKRLRYEEERVDHESEVDRVVQRKLTKWQNGGVRAMVTDDGTRWAPSVTNPRQKISASDLLDLVKRKYTAIRDMVLAAMLRESGKSESDFDSVRLQERTLREAGQLKSRSLELPGAGAEFGLQLSSVLGHVGEKEQSEIGTIETARSQLLASGKSTAETAKLQTEEFQKHFPGASSFGDFLIGLSFREDEELAEVQQRLFSHGADSLMGDAKLILYCQLQRQLTLLKEFREKDRVAGALISVGLAERPQYFAGVNAEAPFSMDRFRQEEIACVQFETSEAVSGPGRVAPEAPLMVSAPEAAGRVDLLDSVVQAILQRNREERKMVTAAVHPTSSGAIRRAMANIKGDVNRRLKQLQRRRTEWKKSALETRRRNRKNNLDIIKEALAIRWNQKRQRMGSDIQASCALLADVQQKQDEEFLRMLNRLMSLTNDELRIIQYEVLQNCANQAMDATAQVVVGSYELSVEEEIVAHMAEKKYDTLRQQLFIETLRAKHGRTQWESFPREQRVAELQELAKTEEALRNDGDAEGLGRLLKPLAGKFPALAELCGPDPRTAEELRKTFLRHQSVQEAAPNEDYLGGHKALSGANVLADLAQRQEMEVEFVLNALAQRQKTRLVVHYFIETLWVSGEWDFAASALSVGLMERVEDAIGGRPRADVERSRRMARARLAARQVDPDFARTLLQQPGPVVTKDDAISFREAIFFEVHRKHVAEREFLMKLLEEDSFVELITEARVLSKIDRQARIVQLETERMQLDFGNTKHLERNISLIEDAGALCVALQEEAMQFAGQPHARDDVTRELLSDLQIFQEAEVARLLTSVVAENNAGLQNRLNTEHNLRRNDVLDNVFSTFTKYRGPADDNELQKAVKDKYDALRDKVLMELLVKQMGEAEWQRLSEKERQRRLQELKLRERQLRRDGNWTALAKLLNEDLACQERLRHLMGDSRAEYERKLRERRAQRRKNGKDDEGDSGIEEGSDEEVEETMTAADVLADLDARYDDEMRALLALLHGRDGQLMSERERQAHLLRLRREALKAGREDNFQLAARLLGLLERQDAAAAERLKGDRERQAEHARQRLAALRARKDKEKFEAAIDKKNPKENLLKLLETKHRQEESFLFGWMEASLKEEKAQILAGQSRIELEDALQALKVRVESSLPSQKNERHQCLFEASHTRLALSQENGQALEEAKVALLAALHTKQNSECQKILTSITSWTNEQLLAVQQELAQAIENATCDNAATAIFYPEESSKAAMSDDALARAVDEKYDALRDKLLMEALMKQFGENEWARMSEQQRQRHLAAMRLKERQLRREGRFDELSRLLGDVEGSAARIAELLRNEKELQEQKLRERLARRKQRLEEGMSEEEADQLMAGEEEKDAKELVEARKNVLLDLDRNCDSEKEELLRRLRELGDGEQAERERQRLLIALRKDQVLARREDGAVAAAMILDLVRDRSGKAQDEERQRQEALARERIAKAKASRSQPSVPQTLDPSETNSAVIATALLSNLESRHEAERLLLVSLSIAAHPEVLTDRSPEQLQAMLASLRREINECGAVGGSGSHSAMAAALGEAASVKMAALMASGQSPGAEEAAVSLMVSLQEVQLAESEALAVQIEGKTAQELHALGAEASAGHVPEQNVARALVGGAEGPDGAVVEAVEAKYDALKDKLLMEGVMRDVGAARWAAMSEMERQAELLRVKREARRLEREGRKEDADALLMRLMGDTEKLEANFKESAEEQKARLDARRKELREARKASGLPLNQTAIEEELQQEEESRKRMNVLERLQCNLDAECRAVLGALGAQSDAAEAERQRQLLLLRLRREQKALALEDADSAALLVLAAAAQGEQIGAEMARARERQRQLAAERLAAAQQRRLNSQTGAVQEEEEATQEEMEAALAALDREAVARAAIAALEERHAAERRLFATAADRDATHGDGEAMRTRLEALRERFTALAGQAELGLKVPEDAKERRTILEEAVQLRVAMEALETDVSTGEAAVTLLAELQTRQDEEMATVARRTLEMEKAELEKLTMAERQSRQEVWASSLAAMVFDAEATAMIRANEELQAIATKDEEAKKERKRALDEVKKREWKKGEEQDKEKMIKEIEAQYKRQLEAVNRERQKALEKVKAKRDDRQRAVLENNAALNLVLASSAADAALSSQNETARQLQSEKTRAMLEARRLARQKDTKEVSFAPVVTEAAETKEPKSSGRKLTPASQRKRLEITPESSEKQQQLADELIVKQQARMEQLNSEKDRQEKLVADAISARATQRKDTSRRVLELAEAQHKALMGGRRMDEDRQRQMILERVERMKYERTLTQAVRKKSSAIDAPPSQEDDKAAYDRMMEEKAAQLQKRFQQQEEAVQSGSKGTNMNADGGTDPSRFSIDSMAPRPSISFASQAEMLENIKAQRRARRQGQPRKKFTVTPPE